MTIAPALPNLTRRTRAVTAAFAVASLFVALGASAAICPAGLAAVDPTPTSDFVVNGNGTVTHKPTGLMWKQCVEGRSGSTCATGSAIGRDWPTALAIAKNSGFGGYSDWRLPNKQELESLMDVRCYAPAINDTVFPFTEYDVTWTNTTLALAPSKAWAVNFYFGDSLTQFKDWGAFVRLVRGGQSFDAINPPLVILNLDGSDSTTGLAPSTAGVLLLRYLLGFRDAALTAGALGTNPQRSAAQIAAYIAANLSAFDVDGDGKVLMTTDGVMILRRLLGLSGTALTAGAKNSTRSDADIAAAIDALKQ